MKLWFRQIGDNHLLRDVTIDETDPAMTRTQKVLHALDEACLRLDLGHPIWLDPTVKQFQLHGRCRFTADAFMEDISFDYLEMRILEEP